MNVDAAIAERRSVRDYTPNKVDENSVRMLLEAAVHAPTAIHEEPWAFSIVQDKDLLTRLSDYAKELLNSGADPIHSRGTSHLNDAIVALGFNIFYNASTLIVICGKPNA
jgi:nitroreductase